MSLTLSMGPKHSVGDLIPGYPKEEESMNHRTVKTPESAVTSLARPNGSLVPPRPSAHVPLGPALPRPTAEGRLRLARRLEGDSASPDGWRATPPRPTAGIGFTRPPGGALRLAQPPRAGLGSDRRLEGDSASPDGWARLHPTPRGCAPPRSTPEGWARLRSTAGGRLRFARRVKTRFLPHPNGQ